MENVDDEVYTSILQLTISLKGSKCEKNSTYINGKCLLWFIYSCTCLITDSLPQLMDRTAAIVV